MSLNLAALSFEEAQMKRRLHSYAGQVTIDNRATEVVVYTKRFNNFGRWGTGRRDARGGDATMASDQFFNAYDPSLLNQRFMH